MNKRRMTAAAVFAGLAIVLALISVFRPHAGTSVPASRRIICTTYPVYLLAKAAAKGSPLQPELLLPADTGCPHDYALTPHDLMKLSGGDVLLIRNGMGLDDAVRDAALRAEPGLKTVSATEGLASLPSETGEEEEEEEEEAHKHEELCQHHGGRNGHLFASPDTAAGMLRNIAAALAGFDPEHAALYEKNAAGSTAELEALAEQFRTAGLQGKKIAVQHDIFAYLARLCGMECAVSLRTEEKQVPGPAEIVTIRSEIKKKGVSVLFSEPQYPQKAAETIAADCGIRFAVLDPCATGPDDADLSYYLDTMRSNLKILRETLGK